MICSILRAPAAVIPLTTSSIPSLVKSSLAYKFAEDVLCGKIISGKRRKQACQRFIDDLEKSQDPKYPWKFDIAKAYRPLILTVSCTTKGDYDKMIAALAF